MVRDRRANEMPTPAHRSAALARVRRGARVDRAPRRWVAGRKAFVRRFVYALVIRARPYFLVAITRLARLIGSLAIVAHGSSSSPVAEAANTGMRRATLGSSPLGG